MRKRFIFGGILGIFFTVFIVSNLWRLPLYPRVSDGKGPSDNIPGAVFWCHQITTLGPNAPQKNYYHRCTFTETAVNSVENFATYAATIAYLIVIIPVVTVYMYFQ